MATIFQQQLAEPDARQASFRVRTPRDDTTATAIAGVQNIVGTVATGVAGHKVQQAQSEFLQEQEQRGQLELQRAEAVREFDQLREDNPAESGVLTEAQNKVERLSRAIQDNRADPKIR